MIAARREECKLFSMQKSIEPFGRRVDDDNGAPSSNVNLKRNRREAQKKVFLLE
jgi:hypothetical protein